MYDIIVNLEQINAMPSTLSPVNTDNDDDSCSDELRRRISEQGVKVI